MAVTDVIERWQGRGATTDENGVRTLKRQWAVTTNDNATGEPAVIDGVVLSDATAALYAPHPNWPWAVCRKLTAAPNGGPRVWLVDAEYSSAPFKASGDGSGAGGNTTSPSPEQSNSTPADQRPPSISGGKRDVTKVLEFDVTTSDRIVNDGVGDPFDPLPEVQRSHDVFTFKFHRLPEDLDWATRSAFRDTVNDDDYTILGRTYPAGELRCTDYSFETVWETGEEGMTLFFLLTVQVEHEPDGWQPMILNTGRRKLVTLPLIGDVAVAIVDKAGQPVADPVPLDAAGVPIPPGGTYHYVTPDGYLPADWTNLLG